MTMEASEIMSSMPRRGSLQGAALALASVAFAASVFASGVPEALANLKGSKESKGNDAMVRAGYQLQGARQNWDRKDSFWWSSRARQCLRMTSRFGFVSGVALVGVEDCRGAAAEGGVAGVPGRLRAADLLGLSRQGGESRLADAGFNAIWVDEGKPDGIPMLWFNQRTGQCIAATVVGNHFEVATDEPSSKCR